MAPFFQKLANLLYRAAKNDGYVDPHLVLDILGVTEEEEAPPLQPTPLVPRIPQLSQESKRVLTRDQPNGINRGNIKF